MPSAKALAYYRSGNLMWIAQSVWGLLVPASILFTGLSARIRDWAARLGKKWFFTVVLYFNAYVAIAVVANLPLTWYEGFAREHAFNLSNQTLGQWFGDV
jgi:hypothetical protein